MTHPPSIQAVTVNHNTSAYTELMLRSFFAAHPGADTVTIKVMDNSSTDDTAPLRVYARQVGVPILPSGFPINTKNNSHGEVLRAFVLANPDCDYYLFLDADVVFFQENTIPGMLHELEATPDAFGVGPILSWDGANPLPEEVTRNPDIYSARLHPCCALVKNTPLFRRVTEEIGFSCARRLWAERDEYLDTFRLMTMVMRTHGLRHIITGQMVMHFFCASYNWDPEAFHQEKIRRRDALLEQLRGGATLNPAF